jgi:hypothetical protein
MPIGYLSDATTVFSNLSLTGTLSAQTVGGTISVATVATSLNIGGGTAITKSAGTQITVVAMACPNATSTTTTAAWSGLSTVDVVTVCRRRPVSRPGCMCRRIARRRMWSRSTS